MLNRRVNNEGESVGMKHKALLLLSLGLLFLIQVGGICWSQTTERVSVDSDGNEGLGPSSAPSISANGRYVAFESSADNLVAGDLLGFIDIFVHDRDKDGNGTYDEPGPVGISTVRVSVDSLGSEGNGHSYSPFISADGMHVAFESNANDLVAGDTNPLSDIFVHDMAGVTTTLVSVDSAGAQDPFPSSSSSPSLSSNGRYVAFDSDADLVATDNNGFFDVFVHDRDTDGDGTYDEVGAISTVRVSVDSAGNEATEASVDPSISANGRYVAFSSFATDLVGAGNDNNGKFDIFVHDRDTDGDGTYDEVGAISTIRVSVDSGGGEADGDSNSPSISADGRYVAFDSDATDLVGSDNNGKVDIFVHDRDADGNGIYDEVGGISTVRVSLVTGGGEGNGNSSAPSISSSDGKYVAFDSYTNLVAADSGLFSDIFVYERESLPPNVDSTSPAHNANGVAVGSSIAATFSEPMNGSTIDANTFTLDNGVTGTVAYDANSTTATFTPTNNLDYDTTYIASITAAAEDLAGNPMLTDYTWSFTTQSEKNNSRGSGPCFIGTSASDWVDF